MLFTILLYAYITMTSTHAFHIPTCRLRSPAAILTHYRPLATYPPTPLYDPTNRYKVFVCLAPNWSNCAKYPPDDDPGIAGQCYNIAGNITGFDPYPEQLCRIYDVEECAATAEEGTWRGLDVSFPGFDDWEDLGETEKGDLRGVRSWRCVKPENKPVP